MEPTKQSPISVATTRKVKAAICLLVIIMPIVSLVFLSGLHPVVAQTQVYEVEETIFIEVVEPGLNASSIDGNGTLPNTRILKITTQGQAPSSGSGGLNIQNDQGGVGFLGAGVNAWGFKDPNAVLTQQGIISGLDYSNAERVCRQTFHNGSQILVNMTDYYTRFRDPRMSFAAIERSIFFDSPNNTAHDYCAANSYTLVRVINSSFEETINYNALNLLGSDLVNQEQLIIDRSSHDLTASADTEIQIPPIVIGIVIAVIAGGCTIAAAAFAAGIISVVAIPTIGRTVVALRGIQSNQDILLGLSNDLLTWQTIVLDSYNNGSITWEEAQWLLQVGGAPFSEALANKTNSVRDLVSDYYTAQQNAENNLASLFRTSWTDVIWIIIWLIIAAIACYAVYAVIKRFASTRKPANLVYWGGR